MGGGQIELKRVSPANGPGQCWICAWPRWLHWLRRHPFVPWEDEMEKRLGYKP